MLVGIVAFTAILFGMNSFSLTQRASIGWGISELAIFGAKLSALRGHEIRCGIPVFWVIAATSLLSALAVVRITLHSS